MWQLHFPSKKGQGKQEQAVDPFHPLKVLNNIVQFLSSHVVLNKVVYILNNVVYKFNSSAKF